MLILRVVYVQLEITLTCLGLQLVHVLIQSASVHARGLLQKKIEQLLASTLYCSNMGVRRARVA
jgi:hypothetical protein